MEEVEKQWQTFESIKDETEIAIQMVEKQWQTFDSIKDETDKAIQTVERHIDVGYYLGENQGMIDMLDEKGNKRLRDAKKELTSRIHQTLEMLINWAMEKERRNSQESSR